MTRCLPIAIGFAASIAATPALAQAVAVSMSLDKSQVAVGESATLRVRAQILLPLRPSSDRIFSWYVDLVNAAPSVARIESSQLAKATADNDPRTSSTGTNEGSNRRGIYDTFLNLAAAGRDAPVELLSVPVLGLAPGTATLRVLAGSGVPGLASDFIVAPSGGGDPILGGDYSAAQILLQVGSAGAGPSLAIAVVPSPDGSSQRVTLSFPPSAGQNHFVEFRDSLSSGSWQVLPGAPHNTGSIVDTTTAPVRFYRLRVGG